MSNQNAQLVREMYQAYGRGDIESVLNSLTDDVVWSSPGPAPFAGRKSGREQVRQFFREMSQAIQTDEFQLDGLLADGDRVVALGHIKGVIRATGRRSDFEWVHVYTVRNGKVSVANMFNNSGATAADFGVSTRAAG